MKIGDLVKVIQTGPRQGEIGLVQYIDERWGTYHGTVNYYRVVTPSGAFAVHASEVEVISESR